MGKKTQIGGTLTCTIFAPVHQISVHDQKKSTSAGMRTYKIAGVSRRGGIGGWGLASLHAGLDWSRPIGKADGLNGSEYKKNTRQRATKGR